MQRDRSQRLEQARQATWLGILTNGTLALIKGVAGVLGHSQALIADAIESTTDVFGSLFVLMGLKVARRPATSQHPYGRGRAETVAAAGISLLLLAAAVGITVTSIHEIRTPHAVPAPYTLAVLLGVMLVKFLLARRTHRVGEAVDSQSVKADAWHHQSDALTSAAAFVGISIALIGGPAYATADDWASLVAAAVIAVNGTLLLRSAWEDLTDAVPYQELGEDVRRVAEQVPGVRGTHRCWVRRHGFDYFVDLDILVDGDLTVREGHDLAHAVHERVRDELPLIAKVMVHVEPDDEYGRFALPGEAPPPA